VILKRCILLVALFLACQTSSVENAHGQAVAPAPEHRKTSEPYTGDLSVFDSPGRDERLQINRVMDILGITPGKTVADSRFGLVHSASGPTSRRNRDCLCSGHQSRGDSLRE